MSSYENAPATRMLATHCAYCRHPLLDAKSVEIGIGPDCRKKHGYNAAIEALTEADRAEANRLVHWVACATDGMAILATECQLRLLGFNKLADIIVERCAAVRVRAREVGLLSVATPYNENATGAWRRIPGRRWDGEKKVNVVPTSSKAAVWALLKTYFNGALGHSDARGPFVIGGAL
jgi:hypothetical protein